MVKPVADDWRGSIISDALAAIQAGSAITITQNSDGTITLASSGGSSIIQIATVTLSAAQLKAIATATQLIATPGSGKLIAIQCLVLQYKAGATPFTIPGSDTIYIGWGTSPENFNASDYLIHASGFLDQATSQVSVSPLAYANGTADLQSAAADQGIYIKKPSGGNMTLGDGTLTLTMYYTVVTLV